MLSTWTARNGHFAFAALLLLATGCGGEGEVGESCDEAGKAGECIDGALCTNQEDGEAVCRRLCDEQKDCPAGHSCNGVSNTNQKSCQPDK